MPITEQCKKGYALIGFPHIIGLRKVSKGEEKIFGEYDSIVKKIIKNERWFIYGHGTLGKSPHGSILPDERGFCHFYDKKNDKCMLGDERPSRC